MQGSDGNFYGTTYQGAPGNPPCDVSGCGSVFRITPEGILTTLHIFDHTDGSNPNASLVQGTDGNFYGTTINGGTQFGGGGTVFKMTPAGDLTTLYYFCQQTQCADGNEVYGGVVQGTDGDFYGMTVEGGNVYCENGGVGCGLVFKVTPSGSFAIVHIFNGYDGDSPFSGLTLGRDGNFYGTTLFGGTKGGGTVFQMTPDGTVTVLHSLQTLDGNYPVAGVVAVSDGNLYGTASQGGTDNFGSVFRVSTSTSEYTLSISVRGNGTVTSADQFINCPGSCSHSYASGIPVTLQANPAPGYSLSSWSGGGCSGDSPTCTVTMNQSQSVTAVFVQDSYTLTVSMSGQGSITSTDGFINCPGTCSHTYLSLTAVTLNASPASGWNFSGWSGQCTGTGQCNLTMLGNYGVSAYFLQPGSGLQFSSVTPCRLIDTRQTNDPIQGGTSQNFTIPQLGGCNIPASASAYSLNVTVAPHGSLGYLTVWPAGLAQPLTSTMNSRDGRTKASAVIVQSGTGNAISIYASNTTDVLLDINGYFSTPGTGTYQYYPLTPCRVIDTRNPDGPLAGPPLIGGQERDFYVGVSTCIPAGVNIQAYSFNVTVVPYPSGQSLRYLTVWPYGETQPQVSTLNNRTATTVANAAIVPTGTDGGISVYASDSAQLIVDINGYFAAPAIRRLVALSRAALPRDRHAQQQWTAVPGRVDRSCGRQPMRSAGAQRKLTCSTPRLFRRGRCTI